MDRTIRSITGMLQSPDGMRRCAAAMVLGELAPKDTDVVNALGAALGDANQLLTRYVLEAFERIDTRNVVPFVLPLLAVEDLETKLRAAGIIARSGGAMVGELKKQFAKANPIQKRVLVDVMARIHSREALQVVLEVLLDPDAELVKEACQAVRRHMGAATPQQRAELHRQTVNFMNGAAIRKNDRVLTSCLLLVGYIGAPDARKVLLQYTSPKSLPHVRRNALLGVQGLHLSGAASAAVVRQVLQYLGEPDGQIVQLALDILDKQPVTGAFDAHWQKLLKSKHATARAFGARKLAAHDTPAINALMMSLLAHPDTQVSEIAAGALARHKQATKPLLAALAKERRTEATWRLAKILKPHSASIDKASLKKFAALAARELESGDPRHEALFYFLRNIDPKHVDNVLAEVGIKFKKARKWAKAVDCLKQLARSENFTQEHRFELAVCSLKQSTQDLAPHRRADDPSLRGLQPLVVDRGFKLLERLKKEKCLEAADLFYVGFHFGEGMGEEGRFGRQLLEYVGKRWPGTKDGKAARNKLKLAQPPAVVATVAAAADRGQR